MKKLSILFSLVAASLNAQTLFSDAFGNLSLQSYTTAYSSTSYTTVGSGYTLIGDGFKNNVGYGAAPNRPFNVPALKTTGWAVVYNAVENDTFLVSTSWLDSAATVDRYAVSPPINNIANNTVLSWYAMAPDASFRDGYEVYITTNTTGTLNASSFLSNDRVFSISDGNTSGGGEQTSWVKRSVSLAAYAGQNIRVAFRNNSKNMYQLWIDQITVENFSNAYDAEVSSGSTNKYNIANASGTISCRVTNKGYANMNSLTLNYSINGSGAVPQTFTLSPSLNPYSFADLSFNAAYIIPTPGYYKLKIWVSDVNGNADGNKLNDTINSAITISATAPLKNVLVEQFVNSNDGITPDASEKLAALASSTVITVNVHDTDSLKNTSITPLITSYRKKNSTALIDRNYFPDLNSVPVERNVYSAHITQRKTAIVPASVSIINKSYNSSTRELIFTAKSDFVGEVQGDYRINAYLVENNVYGPYNDTTDNGWNQLNGFHNIPTSSFYQKGHYSSIANGYLLCPKEYLHQRVLTAAPDGPWGIAGIIPTTGGTQGLSFLRTYTVTLPTATNGQFRYNPDNIYIVGFVAEYSADQNQRTVLNATQDKLNTNPEIYVGIEKTANGKSFSMFPNPGEGNLNILIPENSFTKAPFVKVSDIVGKEVYSQAAGIVSGLLQISLDHLAAGTYYVSLSEGNTKSVQKLIITK